ncbi:TRAP transporter small permease [Aquibium sp. A9E412]|uniref:TRAP transporter small permease n=1 Tax=Aquibium sp. A9E412 TaxID=2976767 RepID=UPI0025B0A23F|nr:TRAP transporter small permease [Aquibium sp. A9E412]MDN2565513.1 TRAP transporter small permease [Aquibium sp. A9E412]
MGHDDDERPRRSLGLALTDTASATLLGFATFLVALQVILRTFFNAPLAWTEELGRYLFVWAVYLGVVAATLRNSHIRVTFVIDRFGPAAERLSLLVGRLAGIFTFGSVAWFGWQIAWNKRNASFYSLPGAPQAMLYLSVPLCLTLVVLVLVWQLGHLRAVPPTDRTRRP